MNKFSNREISRSNLAGAILRLFGERYRAISLTDAGLRLAAGGPKDVTFSEFSGPSKLTRKLGFTGISVPSRDGVLNVFGLKRAAAQDLVLATNSAWQNHFIRQVEAVGGELSALAEVVERLQTPKRYPSACLLEST